MSYTTYWTSLKARPFPLLLSFFPHPPLSPSPPLSLFAAMPPRGTPEERLSRSLSYVLRHGAMKEGLVMHPDGYVFLEALVTTL